MFSIKKYYLFIFLIFVFFQKTYSSHEPKNLNISPYLKTILITDSQGKLIDPGIICSLTQIDEEHLIFCNYQQVFLLNLKNGKAKILPPPSNIEAWYPTGLKFCKKNNTLYIANYLGKDVLLFRFDKDFNLIFVKQYKDNELVGPENIDVSKDGKFFVVADYDNSSALMFNEKGKIWARPVGRAHGITLSKDENTIYVSGLIPPKIYKFDLNGTLLKEHGQDGWKQDGYLWPTSINVYHDKISISDARTGKITNISPSLEALNSIGGNGLGISLFNMPYGIEYTSEGLLYVTDTFKGRILKIDPTQEIILEIFEAQSPNKQNQELIKKQPQASWINGYPPLGIKYNFDVFKNRINKFHLHIPNLNIPKNWNGYLNGLYSEQNKLNNSNATRYLNLFGSYHLMSSAQYYWTFGKDYDKFTILGSPQVIEWLVIYQGIVCPIRIGVDFWINDKELISSRGDKVSFKHLTQEAMKKIIPFIKAIQRGDNPLDAMAEHLYGKFNFAERLKLSFESKEGKIFHDNLILAGQDINKMRMAAKNYLNKIEKETHLYLVENCLASMILNADY
ncbi:hypothetical protein IM40_00130 [Candidatus Paracaedimonas acanthamoebae]|nr:hypothetical protein IM40_00130 [Candidatus Paracaedimonas acanthamoebae]